MNVYWFGTVRQAKVVTVNRNCSNRNNRADIELNGQVFSMKISREECVNQVFRPGDAVEVKYDPDFDIVLRLHERPDVFMYAMLGVFITIVTFVSAHYYWKWREAAAKKALGLQPAKQISPRQRRKMRRKNL
ncbi:hypothetical protein [Chitinophaga caseinilytica]|uniref:hypothetical protein n=1 Tax=Chitinophaga caseinilytica TaxID=2267521 RepID=UPI003C2D7BBE